MITKYERLNRAEIIANDPRLKHLNWEKVNAIAFSYVELTGGMPNQEIVDRILETYHDKE